MVLKKNGLASGSALGTAETRAMKSSGAKKRVFIFVDLLTFFSRFR